MQSNTQCTHLYPEMHVGMAPQKVVSSLHTAAAAAQTRPGKIMHCIAAETDFSSRLQLQQS